MISNDFMLISPSEATNVGDSKHCSLEISRQFRGTKTPEVHLLPQKEVIQFYSTLIIICCQPSALTSVYACICCSIACDEVASYDLLVKDPCSTADPAVYYIRDMYL